MTTTTALAAATAPPSPEEPPYISLILKDLLMLFDRALDTVEDVGVHLRRATERDLDRRFRKDRLSTKSTVKPRVLILGTGWAAHAVAKIIGTLVLFFSNALFMNEILEAATRKLPSSLEGRGNVFKVFADLNIETYVCNK